MLYILMQREPALLAKGIGAMIIYKVVGFSSARVCLYVLIAIRRCVSTYRIQELGGDTLTAHIGCDEEADDRLDPSVELSLVPELPSLNEAYKLCLVVGVAPADNAVIFIRHVPPQDSISNELDRIVSSAFHFTRLPLGLYSRIPMVMRAVAPRPLLVVGERHIVKEVQLVIQESWRQSADFYVHPGHPFIRQLLLVLGQVIIHCYLLSLV